MFLLVALMLILSIPAVQTKLASIVTNSVNKDFGTNLEIEKVDLSLLGSVSFKGVKIRDHHKDTLIFVKNLSTSVLNAKKIIDNEVDLGAISLSGVHFYMKTYKGEEDDNMAVFLQSFDDGTPKDSTSNPFVLKTDNIYVEDLQFRLTDENKETPLLFSATDAGGNIQDFSLIGSDVSMKVRGLYLIDNRGINIRNLTTNFVYTKQKMELLKTVLATNNASKINGDIVFNYKREDFANFTDKVKIKALFKKSAISAKDLNKFYSEIGGNDNIFFSGRINGVLNNFSAENLNMYSRKGMRFKGSMGFLNAFNSDRGFVFDADIKNITSSYEQLKSILPNVLGKTLPTKFKKLGVFSMEGQVKVTPEQMDATLAVNSEIGATISDLQITNIDDIDNAEYNGEVEFIDLDLGELTNDPILGKTSLKADVLGGGLTADNINTTLIGEISKIDFKGYTYKNLNVNGQIANRKFDGFLQAADENFKLNFKGLADFSKKTNKFDFTADIDKIDLQKTKLFTRDSIAVLKGKIKLDVSGNTLDDVVGTANFKDIVYTNQKQRYNFKEFNISSAIKDSVQTIKINSKDIVEGQLTGKFKFAELLPVTQNALWSMYTNYVPVAVTPNQFINFDFVIYNQIVDIFLPQVSVGKNTRVKGKINANDNSVKFTFSSPKIDAYKNIIDKIKLRVDNKNMLYNTHLTADKVATNYYDISKLNLINRTVNDTLFFKSTFKGGKKQTEKFNLDFFYTVNEFQKSVVGVQKSKINYKNTDWFINPKDTKENKVTFDLEANEFQISPFLVESGEQKINLKGFVKGNDKDIDANFSEVSLQSFLPDIENLKLEGLLNGSVKFFQKGKKISPLADITINDVVVNEFSQGTLKAKIKGDNSLDKYKVDVSIRDYQFDNVKIVGSLDFSKEKPTMDVLANFRDYELNGFSDFGGEVISNLRGMLSGNFTSKGELLNPDFKGSLNLKNAGLTFPYLNIDFDFIKNANIKLDGRQFKLNNIVLQDTKYDTKGYLSGSFAHKNFNQWALNLDLNTPNLLVLDTKEAEEVPYYGKGFLRGNVKIRGLTSNLIIDVNGSTQPGTIFVIPLSDVTTVSNYKLIRFKTGKKVDENYEIEKIKGLNLKINLDVTKDAVAQIVIDKASGSDLKGSGTGKLNIEIDTRGKFIMNGDLEIDNGVYNFKYGGLITKPFKVQKGGTISWSGDPASAELDLTAVYQTKANPAQLLDNINSTRKIPIDLYTKITGGLFNSKQDFDIKIPNANSTVANELSFKLNDNDVNTKMQHFVWLLATGTFYNEEALGESVNAGLTGTAADIASNLLSNMLNSKDGKIQVGVGFTQADKTSLNQVQSALDDVVDVSVTTQISDRVLFNGKVGVPVGANTQTNVVGEAKLEVLLNEKGNLRWTVFNKPNDVQYSLEEEGYTQGTGISYQVNFNNLKELGQKIGLVKKPKKVVQKNDTIVKKKRGLINFKASKKDTTNTKNEQPKNK